MGLLNRLAYLMVGIYFVYIWLVKSPTITFHFEIPRFVQHCVNELIYLLGYNELHVSQMTYYHQGGVLKYI